MAEPATKRRRPEGITVRHGRHCAADVGGRCGCRPTSQDQVISPRDRRTIRKSFKTLADARTWRSDTKAALRRGTLRAQAFYGEVLAREYSKPAYFGIHQPTVDVYYRGHPLTLEGGLPRA